MFSSAVSVGIRLNAWKTNPIRSRRSAVSSLSLRRPSSVPPTSTAPDDGVSSAAMQCISVDLPEPDGPMIAVNWPASRSRLTPARACTAESP